MSYSSETVWLGSAMMGKSTPAPPTFAMSSDHPPGPGAVLDQIGTGPGTRPASLPPAWVGTPDRDQLPGPVPGQPSVIDLGDYNCCPRANGSGLGSRCGAGPIAQSPLNTTHGAGYISSGGYRHPSLEDVSHHCPADTPHAPTFHQRNLLRGRLLNVRF